MTLKISQPLPPPLPPHSQRTHTLLTIPPCLFSDMVLLLLLLLLLLLVLVLVL